MRRRRKCWAYTAGQKPHSVRVYERQIRVDTIVTSAFIAVVRRRVAA